MLHEVGTRFDKEVIEIETSLRDFSDEQVGWPRYHGAALASVALCLQRSFAQIYVASTHPYDKLKPWGSSPLLDPFWSTRQMEIIHDGCEVDWLEKCRQVRKNKVALLNLRVCWENRSGTYNFGGAKNVL